MSDSVRPQRRQPTRLPHPWDSPGKNTGVDCHFLLQCMKVKSESEVAQSCPTLSDPMDCSLPGSSAHGIFQAGVLEWVPYPSRLRSIKKKGGDYNQAGPSGAFLGRPRPHNMSSTCLSVIEKLQPPRPSQITNLIREVRKCKNQGKQSSKTK